MRIIIATIAFVMLTTPSWAGDFNKGLEAYDNGDYATALEEWTPLAEQGDAVSQFYLGFLYSSGKGVPQNYKNAVKWYALAAEQGDAEAQHNLALRYDLGQGVLQDYKTAVKWYTLAAEQGLTKSQYNLGVSYALGEGVIQDYIKAHMWFNIAAANGQDDSSEARDTVQESMTPAQIEQAQALARECVKKEYKDC